MKKLGLSLFFAAIALCGCKTGLVTYETTSFDGTQISINESNICYQKPEDNVLESTKVPSRLETAAPGRDYVYLENEFYYFVEDASRGLLTIARKEDGAESVLLGESFLFSYRKDSFSVAREEDNVILTYADEAHQAPGDNVVSMTLVQGTDCESLMLAKMEEKGGEQDRILISELYGVPGNTLCYISALTSEDSGLSVSEYQYAVPCGNDVVYIDVIRTICNDDEIDMPVDADFEYLFQSFIVLL